MKPFIGRTILLLGSLLQLPSRLHIAAAGPLPLVVTTWFAEATDVAWAAISSANSSTPALDAIELGCTHCEMHGQRCDHSVGFGGNPDETNEVTLDAHIMTGDTLDAGAVCDILGIKEATSAARYVMERTTHTILSGAAAADFAQQMGLKRTSLSTHHSAQQHSSWKSRGCQPNFWRNVVPDPGDGCGPYHPDSRPLRGNRQRRQSAVSRDSHDTISMVAIDSRGHLASGSSSNGLDAKIPGRSGDACIPGGGSYVDNDVGGCGSTGNGDLHIRFQLCFLIVELMRGGASPQKAADVGITRIAKKYPEYVGAAFAVDASGKIGAACFGWTFKYAVRDSSLSQAELREVKSLIL